MTAADDVDDLDMLDALIARLERARAMAKECEFSDMVVAIDAQLDDAKAWRRAALPKLAGSE
jgi:putative hemolysin